MTTFGIENKLATCYYVNVYVGYDFNNSIVGIIAIVMEKCKLVTYYHANNSNYCNIGNCICTLHCYCF